MRIAALIAFAALTLSTVAAVGETYPARPVTIIVGFPPGTATDSVARLLADNFTRNMGGSRFIVDNRAGQGGSIGATAVARAEPDGYTIAIGASGPLAINPHVYSNLRYNSRSDFTAIGQIVQLPYVLVANKDAPYRTMRDLVEAAKAKPGIISYGSTGNGTTSHLLMAMLEHATKTSFNHIRYRGTAQSMTDILAGRLDVTFDTLAGSLPFISDGSVRPLAVSTLKRSSLLPEVPTTAEAGYSDVQGGAWLALVGPAKLPPDIVAKLGDALASAMKDEKMQSALRTLGTELDPSSADAMTEILRRDYDRWGEIVKLTGAKAE
jgi:tripartite-type tricarboxylate transporter receptor subunit TctC